ncbi:hypothetical protein LCGC14_0394500 [marine sediment metagenome]|uniref:Uncharacterized protein n=1 Tax=marine sediment metagenome TaxID=412755 RepID=A0A0F9SYT8_9ZZZZ
METPEEQRLDSRLARLTDQGIVTDAEADKWQGVISHEPPTETDDELRWKMRADRLLRDRNVAMEIIEETSRDCCWYEQNLHWMLRDNEGSCGGKCPRCKARALVAATRGEVTTP